MSILHDTVIYQDEKQINQVLDVLQKHKLLSVNYHNQPVDLTGQDNNCIWACFKDAQFIEEPYGEGYTIQSGNTTLEMERKPDAIQKIDDANYNLKYGDVGIMLSIAT